MSVIIDGIQAHWRIVHPPLSIHNEKEYDLAIKQLNVLIDEVGDNEEHPLYELLQDLRNPDCSCPIHRALATVSSGDESPNYPPDKGG